ncbi:MAG: 4-hydroxy-tetrahydrodipicolinate reductase [Treponema sp.]|nr:4-hydroxy-tetrahydrodipicolinate reductase [Treponema sp.]
MKIALIGYGKMGRLLELAALSRGHLIIAVVDPFTDQKAAPPAPSRAPFFKTISEAEGALAKADAAVEFTRPDAAAENINALAERKIPAVVGTTGWLEHLEILSWAVKTAGSSLLWAPNFSLGVHLFYRIAAYAARNMDPFPEYDVGGFEAHHNKKADSPSGTAKTLVEQVLSQMTRKTRADWEVLDSPPHPALIHFPSLRIGSVPGTHTLIFDSPADTITITHSARNRDGFAAGAIRAAEWLVNCPGPGMDAGEVRRGVFTIDDVLQELL